MGFKDFVKKMANDLKESQKPENVKKKLEAKIEQEKLRNKLEKIQDKRRKRNKKKYDIKIGM